VCEGEWEWKSEREGADWVEIHPRDLKYVQGRYYIGVLAYGGATCRYHLQTSLSRVPQITLIRDNATGEGNWEYFQYHAKWPGASRLQVKVTNIEADSSLYLSTSAYYPSEAKCHWYVSSPWLWEAEMQELYLDPYREMPKQYVKPKAKWAKRQKTEAMQGYEDEPGTMTLCIDTETPENGLKSYYMGISNPGKCSFHISVVEVLLVELLSEPHQRLLSIFHSLTADLQGAFLSHSERERLALPHYGQFTYGEVEFASMIPMLELCSLKAGEVFWDLGCGTGKCLITAALLYPDLAAVKGVELLEGLYAACCGAVSALQVDSKVAMAVIQGDILAVDWSEADLVYVSSLCFPETLLTEIAIRMEKLKPGARVLSLKAFLPSSSFLLLHSAKAKMTWGPASVYLYHRL